jgi:predicted TIM-barrel enzyme
MSLLGEKCIRCGVRTRNLYLNKPTCESCVEHIKLVLASAREIRRACPADGSELAKEVVHGVIIDRCPACKGVWLDAGEMERMNEDVAAEVWKTAAFARTPFG